MAVETLVLEGELLRRRGDYHGAIRTLRMALASDPDHARAHATLALALLGVRRIAGAAAEAERALLADGGDPYSHHAAAAVKLAQHRLAEAWGYARVAVTADGDPEVHVLAAAIRSAQGDRGMARTLLGEALAIEPGHLGALAAQAELDLAEDNLPDARRGIATVLAVEPGDLHARVIAGRIALAAGDLPLAETHARFVLSHDSGDRGAIEIWIALKARRGLLLGAWWKLSGFTSVRSDRGRLVFMIATFVLVRLAIIVAAALGHTGLEDSLHTAWLAFCAYTWTAPTVFRWMLQREVQTLQV